MWLEEELLHANVEVEVEVRPVALVVLNSLRVERKQLLDLLDARVVLVLLNLKLSLENLASERFRVFGIHFCFAYIFTLLSSPIVHWLSRTKADRMQDLFKINIMEKTKKMSVT